MSLNQYNHSRGAASIFVVAFFMILIGVITLSFVNIVIQDQKQALNNDLYQSAYDSVTAGTEDAQRVLKWYGANCSPQVIDTLPDDNATKKDCKSFANGDTCNVQKISDTNRSTILPGVQTAGNGQEVKIVQDATGKDTKFDQAYTCVTVKTQTDDYKASLVDGKSDTLIPLKTPGNIPVSTIDLKWYSVGNGSTADVLQGAVTLPNQNKDSIIKSLKVSNADSDSAKGEKWGSTTPPILRVEIIPVSRSAIDINAIKNNTRTVFIYPSKSGTIITNDIDVSSIEPEKVPKATSPWTIKCNDSATNGQYVCATRLTNLIYANGDPATTDIFLRVTPVYNGTNLLAVLHDAAGNVLKFDNVAPELDSTGRANDAYRRVQTRVQTVMPNNPTSDGGFDITQGLCKDFQVPIYKNDCPASLKP